MATKSAVWGIDIGQCALKAIKLQAAGDKVEILAYDVVDHDRILSHPEVDAAACIKSCIEKFLGRNDIKGDLIAVGVPGQQTLSRFTKLPPVEAKRIPDIVKFEAGQQIPFDMEEVVWDYQTFSEPESPDVEVGIFAIRKELIRAHLAYFTQAKIEPVLVQPSPLALYNAIRFDLAKADKATILLDIGAQATDLIVMEGSTIWSRPVPIGGNAFTEALVKAFKLSHDKAENLKRTAASTKYARQVFQAMRPVFADLISEIQRSIGFYTATHRESEVTRILGVGNAFKLPGLQKFMQQNLQIEVDKFDEFKRIAPTQVSRSPEFQEAAPSLAVAFGLALQGLEMAPISSSLLPPEIAKQIVWRKKTPWFAAAAACLLGTAGVIWFSNSRAQAALGELQGAASPVATTQNAESVLASSAAGQSPGQFARSVAAAVNKLNSEYNTASTPKGPGSQALELVKKAGPFTALVPRLVHTVHVTLSRLAPGIPDAKTGAEYVAKINDAKRRKAVLENQGARSDSPEIEALNRIIDRKLRKELWMQHFAMQYYPDVSAAPETAQLGEKLAQKDREEISGKPGWILKLDLRTTDPQPASWIENDVIPALLRGSLREKQGFYFAGAKIIRQQIVSAPLEDIAGFGGGVTNTSNVDQSNAGGRRGGGRNMFDPPAPNNPAPTGTEGPAGGASGGTSKFEWTPDLDPLTLEKYVNSDSLVTVNLVAVKADAPERLIASTRPAAPADQPANKNAKPAGKDGR